MFKVHITTCKRESFPKQKCDEMCFLCFQLSQAISPFHNCWLPVLTFDGGVLYLALLEDSRRFTKRCFTSIARKGSEAWSFDSKFEFEATCLGSWPIYVVSKDSGRFWVLAGPSDSAIRPIIAQHPAPHLPIRRDRASSTLVPP